MAQGVSVGAGGVSGGPRAWLRAEGGAVLAVAVFLYAEGGHSWWVFAALFLWPDVSFLGYAAGARAGALLYNAVHSYVGPLVLSACLLAGGQSLVVPLAWFAHIGFDRLLGYGLKYATSFADTHLGRIGQQRPTAGEAGNG